MFESFAVCFRARPRAGACRRATGAVPALLALLAFGLAPGALAQGVTNTWKGSVDRNWFTDANWSFGTRPAPGQHVSITNAAGNRVLLTNNTPLLASITISNSSLTFSNWTTTLYASNVHIRANGMLTLPGAFSNAVMSNAVRVVCSEFIMNAGGMIMASTGGYASVYAGPGQGPGGGSYDANSGGGGGYGGKGGESLTMTAGGGEYGVSNAPAEPGSSGGSSKSTYASGSGGGYVSIGATNVVLDGAIYVNGGSAGQYAGGGSGGGVWIQCVSLGGTGTVYARGGSGGAGNQRGGGGGGGRVALAYQSISGNVRVDATPGSDGNGQRGWRPLVTYPFREFADAGTLYMPSTNGWLTESLVNSHMNVRLCVPGFTSWSPRNLTLSNCVLKLYDNFSLNVASNLAIRAGGGLVLLGAPQLKCGSDLTLDGGELHMNLASPLNCGGNLVLTNSAKMYVYSGITNNASQKYGGLVSVTGDLVVATNSWIYPTSDGTNGGSVMFSARSFTLLTPNCGINADSRGFQGSPGHGRGPGASPGATSHRAAGAGYGGVGGLGYYNNTWYGDRGTNYGRIEAPIEPGSGGGGRWSDSHIGGSGGGLIWINVAGKATINGTLSANGQDISSYAGAGSGGGIFVACGSFEGGSGGLMQVRGGGCTGGGGGAGGGRVAVAIRLSAGDRDKLVNGEYVARLQTNYSYGSYFGGINVTNGTSPVGDGNISNYPTSGTFAYITTAYILNIAGDPGDYGHPGPALYGNNASYSDGQVVTNSVASPDDELDGARHACIGWSLKRDDGAHVSSGPSTEAVFQMTTNLNLTWRWTNEYLLTVSGGVGGNVTTGMNGWYTNGMVVTGIAAAPSPGFVFFGWSGPGVPPGHEEDNPLTVTMDQAREIGVVFGTEAGQTKTWNGDGAWDSAENWSPVGIPARNDLIVIESGSLTMDNSKRANNLEVKKNATLVFANWDTKLRVNNEIVVFSNGTISCAGPFTTNDMSNSIHLVSQFLQIDKGGKITVDGCGHAGITNLAGAGPGGGAAGGGGGGHGGKGGDASGTVFGGGVYDVYSAPALPGSSGGGSTTVRGGAGGGVVRIQATNLLVNGSISANGGNAPAQYSGGGAGGTIHIVCANFGGAGTISAKGGNGNSGGGGGGGRIALHYENMAEDNAVSYHAAPGSGVVNGYFRSALPSFLSPADMGSLFLSRTNGWLTENMNNMFQHVRLEADSFTEWAPAALSMTNCRVRMDGIGLNVVGDLTIGSNAVLLIGGDPGLTCGGTILLENGGQLVVLSSAQFNCSGNMTLTNNARFDVQSMPTNESRTYGTQIRIHGTLDVSPNCWIYPRSDWENGGSARFYVRHIRIAAGGGISADTLGFSGGYPTHGLGPGFGADATGRGGGGGYGGKGGWGYDRQWMSPGGVTYGSSNHPVHAGSGAGGAGAARAGGGSGGGLVWIEAKGRMIMDGSITASGGAGGYDSGGGAGGGIHLLVDSIQGGAAAKIEAKGGNGNGNSYDNGGGPGGGGRIAIHSRAFDFNGTMSVTNGSVIPYFVYLSYPERAPTVGTIYIRRVEQGYIFNFYAR